MKNSIIRFSHSARNQFEDVRKVLEVPKEYNLQVIVESEVGEELEYSFKFKHKPSSDEMQYKHDDFNYILDADSALLLMDSEVDFRNDEFVLNPGICDINQFIGIA
ncbi:hypothetical protein H8D85_01495 [bacterium]|nr:hypothetical protein [bacterium]